MPAMPKGDCIDTAVKAGKVKETTAAQLRAKFSELVKEHVAYGMTPAEARVLAGQTLAASIESNAKVRERLKTLQVVKQDAIDDRVKNAVDGDVAGAINATLAPDPRAKHKGPNVEQRHESLRQDAMALAIDFINKFRSKNAGLYKINKDYTINDVRDVIRALFDEKVDNPNIKALVGGMKEARKFLVDHFNAAGGNIKMREAWGWTQTHDADRMKKMGKNAWVKFTMDRLDRTKMLDDEGKPMTDGQLAKDLHAMWEETTGANPTLKAVKFVSPVHNRSHSRELIFKNADAWFEYATEAGKADIMQSFIQEIDRLARDTAMLQILGPYPRATIAKLVADPRLTKTQKEFTKNLFDQVTGASNLPISENFAKWSAGWRHLSTAAKLGSSVFISVTDFATTALTAAYNGLPMTKIMGTYLKQLASSKNRMMAARAGYIGRSWAGDLLATQRILGELNGAALTARMADSVLRMSGMTAHTEALRNAFKLTFLGEMTEFAAKKTEFERMPKRLQRAMKRHGVSKEDWNMYRETKAWKDPDTGATFIKPESMYTKYQGDQRDVYMNAANRIADMINGESKFASIEPGARTKAWMIGDTKAGTAKGEAWRHFLLFRSFTVSMLYMHGARMTTMDGALNKIGYSMALFVPFTVAGAFAMQASSLAQGKETRKMDGEFWAEAVVRGGALGPVADLIHSTTRDSGDILEAILGPSASDIKNAATVVGGAATLDIGDVTRGGSKLVKGLMPGATLWYTRAMLQRMVYDQVELLGDPDAATRFRRAETKARKDYDQSFWWKPGRATPGAN